MTLELEQLKTTHVVTLSQVHDEKAKTLQYLHEVQQLRAETSEKEAIKTEENCQALEQLKASHDAELVDLRRKSNFFKNNSDRLSKQTKVDGGKSNPQGVSPDEGLRGPEPGLPHICAEPRDEQ